MSPDLGRFLQPDPIGFKGDASNLYRYCGNDWANRSDPMGTLPTDQAQRIHEQDDQNQRPQVEHSLPLAQVLSYHVYQVWGVAHGTLAQMQQTMGQVSLQTAQNGVGGTVTRDYNTSVKTSMTAEHVMGAVEQNINRFSDSYNGRPGGIYFDPSRIKQGQVYTIYGIPIFFPKVQATSVSRTSFTFTTVKGQHFEAGTITFSARNTASGVNFNIHSAARAASWSDWGMYNYVGRQMQTATWNNFLHNVEEYASPGSGP